jgi:hypothetical protein
MTTEPTFLALPEDPTFNVWRIENFVPVPWPDVGAFYSGDSYLVLSAVYAGNTKRVTRDIYYWIGSESTQDEYGTAAIKAVELDDRFGGEPTQHREVQYHESDAFHKLFESYGGVRYLDGGVPSGFKPVDVSAATTLYQVKGRRNPVLLKVPPQGSSLNHGDAFILTSSKAVFLWLGKGANIQEKAKAAQVLDTLLTRFRGVKKTRLENSETTPEFWELLGGEVPIAEAADAGADTEVETANTKKIFKVTAPGQFALVAEGVRATVDLLTKPTSQLVIQRGEAIVVYLPKGTSQDVKKRALEIGTAFLAAQKLPSWFSVTVAVEGVKNETIDLIFA